MATNSRCYLGFNPNTKKNVRKEFNLDKPGQMEQAVKILEDWVQKQQHFLKKDFPRDYLEGFIIDAKGSVEKAKRRLDRLCTLRTMVPNLFETHNVKKDFPKMSEFALNIIMPHPTKNDYRLHIGKLVAKQISAPALFEVFQQDILLMEYGKMYDYVKGYYTIVDIGDLNVLDAITKLDMIALRNMLTLITEGYGVRLKGIYIISSSNVVSALTNLIKQFMSAKLGDRVHAVKTPEALYKILPREALPKDYGGDQKSIAELFDELTEDICSEKNLKLFEELNRARTNEELRQSDKFSQDYLGMPGSFKMLSVD